MEEISKFHSKTNKHFLIYTLYFLIILTALYLLSLKQSTILKEIKTQNFQTTPATTNEATGKERVKRVEEFQETSLLHFKFSSPKWWHVHLDSSTGSYKFSMSNMPIIVFPHHMPLINGSGKSVESQADYQNAIKKFLNFPEYEEHRDDIDTRYLNVEELNWKSSDFETSCYRFDMHDEFGMFGNTENNLQCFVLVESIFRNVFNTENDTRFLVLYDFVFYNYYEFTNQELKNTEEVFKYFIESLKSL
jgi:hypothetical protein